MFSSQGSTTSTPSGNATCKVGASQSQGPDLRVPAVGCWGIDTFSRACADAAGAGGFVREGVLRSSAWVMGEFLDEVLLGLLAQDWKPDSKV